MSDTPLTDGTRTLPGLVMSAARKYPDRVAVVDPDRVWTYQELVAEACRIADELDGVAGCQPAGFVGVCVAKGGALIAAALGVMLSGRVYVPLDPNWPVQRISFVCEDLAVGCVVGDRDGLELARQEQTTGIVVRLGKDSGAGPITGIGRWSARLPRPSDLAYVMYTSGSTGLPKAVGVQHAPAVHIISWINSRYGVGVDDRLLFVTPATFDLSIYDMFGLLAVGGSVRVVSETDSQNTSRLAEYLCAGDVTVWDSTPGTLQEVLPFVDDLSKSAVVHAPRVRLALLSGDWIPGKLPGEVAQRFAEVEVVALGGATEATIWSNYFEPLRRGTSSLRNVPYGRAVDGAEYYVLDDDLAPCPVGVPGELYIGGSVLAVGYLGRPELTARQFVPNPFVEQSPGSRMYRTGDLVERSADYGLIFLGRHDDQVKVRGARVELGEVDSVLATAPAIRHAVSAVSDRSGQQELVGYLVANAGDMPSLDAVRRHCASWLPRHMVPSRFVLVDALPYTSTGKVDRNRLADGPSRSLPREAGMVEATTAAEQRVRKLWSHALGLADISVTDNFFDVGGNSLSAVRIVREIGSQLDVEISLHEFFAHPTVRQLAAMLATRSPAASRDAAGKPVPAVDAAGPHVPATSRRDEFGLSNAQQRVWFLERLHPGNRAYCFNATLQFRGRLNAGALKAALEAIVDRHEIFRTTFEFRDGKLLQKVHAVGRVDLRIDTLGPEATSAEAWINDKVSDAFALDLLPLVRWNLLHVSPTESVLVHSEHHILHDGWSFNLFLEELSRLYNAAAGGRSTSAELPEPQAQYRDYVDWEESWQKLPEAQRDRTYWQRVLHSPSVPPFPRAQSDTTEFVGDSFRTRLNADLAQALSRFAIAHDVTLFMVMVAAMYVLLQRRSGQRDVALGTGVANRTTARFESALGMFINTVVLKLKPSEAGGLESLLQHVRQVTLEAYQHSKLPFGTVVEDVNPPRSAARNPLFQVILGFHDSPLGDVRFDGLDLLVEEAVPNRSAKFDLNVIVVPDSPIRPGSDGGGGMALIWEYSTSALSPDESKALCAEFLSILTDMSQRRDVTAGARTEDS